MVCCFREQRRRGACELAGLGGEAQLDENYVLLYGRDQAHARELVRALRTEIAQRPGKVADSFKNCLVPGRARAYIFNALVILILGLQM